MSYLTLPSLRAFAECPAYYHFLQHTYDTPTNRRVATVISVVKKCYMLATETGYRASWKRLLGWVDEEVFAEVDVHDPEAFKAARTLSERILRALSVWYHEVYMTEDQEAFVDLDLSMELGQHVIADCLDVIQVGDPVRVTVFTEVGVEPFKMYNDIVVRGRAWLTARNLGCDEVAVRIIGIGERGGLTMETLRLGSAEHRRVSSTLLHIATSMERGVRYPSRRESCGSCPFNRRCIL